MDKGNIAGALLVALLIIISGVVYTVTVKTNVLQGSDVSDPQKIITETKIGVEDLVIKGVETAAGNGYSNATKAWYCNKPLIPTPEEAKSLITRYIQDNMVDLQQALQDEGVLLSNPSVTLREEFAGNLDPEKIEVLIKELNLTINDSGTLQRYNLSNQYLLRSRFWYMYQKLSDWMSQCNAGNVTNQLADLMKRKTCKFAQCGCGTSMVSEDAIAGRIERHGLKEEEVKSLIEQSINSLNNLMRNGSSCSDSSGSVQGISCEAVVKQLVVENEPYVRVQAGCYGDTDVAELGTSELILEWGDESTTIPPDGCPSSPPRYSPPVDTSISNQGPEPKDNDVPRFGRDRVTTGVMVIDKKAAALYEVRCTDTGAGAYQPLTVTLELRFNLENECDFPEPSSLTSVSTPPECVIGGGNQVPLGCKEFCEQQGGKCSECMYTGPELPSYNFAEHCRPKQCPGSNGCPSGICNEATGECQYPSGGSCTKGSCGLRGECRNGYCRVTEPYFCCEGSKCRDGNNCCNGVCTSEECPSATQ